MKQYDQGSLGGTVYPVELDEIAVRRIPLGTTVLDLGAACEERAVNRLRVAARQPARCPIRRHGSVAIAVLACSAEIAL